MTIEIYSPHPEVSEKVVNSIKRRLVTLSHLSEKISRAEVFLIEENSANGYFKACKIRLDIFGDTLFVHKAGKTFEQSVALALAALRRRLRIKPGEKNRVAGEVVSTVNV